MVKWYYTVIVGTQPGVYTEWSQAAPTVIEVSGAIHKKFKTYREAREAFDRAWREGRVRAIEVDPQPDDFGAPAPVSSATLSPVVPGHLQQRDLHQDVQYPQNAPPACATGRTTHHPATRSVLRASQQDRTANSTANDVTWQIRRGPGNTSSNTSSPVSAHNVDLVTIIGAGPLWRTMSEYHGNSRQPLRTMSGYINSSGSPGSLSSPSEPAGRSRVYEHANFPGGESSSFSSWQGEDRQNNEQGTAAPPGSPRVSDTPAQHGEARAAGTSAEIGPSTPESPSSALLRSSQTGHSTQRVSGESQIGDISGTAARPHRQLLGSFPVSDARATIGSDHWGDLSFSSHRSPIPSTLDDWIVDYDEGQERRGVVFDFLSGLERAQSQGSEIDRREIFQSVVTSLDSSGSTQRVQSSHTQLQTRTDSHSSLGAPILPRPSSACSHISSASSAETIGSTLSFDVDLTQAETSEEPENVAGSTPPPTLPLLASSGLVGDIFHSPQTLSQSILNQGDRGEDMSPGEQRRASSSQSGGAVSPVEHMHSQFDHSNTEDETPSPLPPPLSPLLVASTSPTPTHHRTQNIRLNIAGTAASSPRGVWPTSPPSHFSFEPSLSPTSGLGLSAGVASPRRHSQLQSPAAQDFTEIPVDRSVRGTDAQSPTRDTGSSRDAPQQDYASSPHLSVPTPKGMQSVRTRSIDCGTLSHHNIPLPPSPASSAPDSFTRLQVQPVHRRSARMPLYPSLAGEDRELLSPSGLDVVFGLPTPGLSPIQAPVVIRSPVMDPRSPVPSRIRIPGDIMGTVFFGRPTPSMNNARILP